MYQTLMKVADTPGKNNKFLAGLINVLRQQGFWLAHIKLDTHLKECHPEFLKKLEIIKMERATHKNESLDDFSDAVARSGLQIDPLNPKAGANSGYVYCYLLKITKVGTEKNRNLLKEEDALKSVASNIRQSAATTRSILLSR